MGGHQHSLYESVPPAEVHNRARCCDLDVRLGRDLDPPFAACT